MGKRKPGRPELPKAVLKQHYVGVRYDDALKAAVEKLKQADPDDEAALWRKAMSRYLKIKGILV